MRTWIRMMLVAAVATSVGFAGKNVIIAEDPVIPVSEGSFYVGAGVSLVNFDYTIPVYVSPDMEDKEVSHEWKAGTFLAGYAFNSYISVEGRYTKSFGDATVTLPSGEMRRSPLQADEIENLAIYLKPALSFDALKLYGLLGYGKTTITWTNGTENSDSGFQYGAGLSYSFNENWSIFADYVVMHDDDKFDDLVIAGAKDFKVTSATVGLMYTF